MEATLTEAQHAIDAVTVDNLTRELAQLKRTCRELEAALERSITKVTRAWAMRHLCILRACACPT